MKIGILALASPHQGGIYQYTISILEALKLIEDRLDFVQIRYQSFPKILKKDIVVPQQNTSILLKIRRAAHALIGMKLGNLLPYWDCKLNDMDLIISPIITLCAYHLGRPYIVTVHDFQHKYYPEFFTIKEHIMRKIVYKAGKKAKLVVCESNYVKNDIIRFLRVKEEKIRVIICAPPSYLQEIEIKKNKSIDIKGKYKLSEKYVFYAAQFWYHKNHIKLIEALAIIKEKYGIEIPLVLVGSMKNNFQNTMKKIEELKLEHQVRYLGYVPNEDMPYLYKLSTAIIIPTLFESVSMPIWEAFHFGCPVVSSNVCALPEQIGDAGLLFDPHNIEDMAEKIYRIWTDEKLRQELVKKGYESVKELTLENYAKNWERIIEEALKEMRNSVLSPP